MKGVIISMGITSSLRILFYGCLCLFSPLLWSNEELDAFVNELSTEQRALLDRFLRSLIQDSLSGYVLYGDKPMCIEAHTLLPETGALTGFNDLQTILTKGGQLWQDLSFSVTDKNYFLLPVRFGEYRHFICINRNAFIRVVNENLSLFRYVLGPMVTAEDLLNALIQAKDGFYDVLKNDNALLGILLGYGTQNALLVSRKELITDAFACDRTEDFPFLSRKDRMQRRVLPNAQVKRPSLGFMSLADEVKEINKRTVVSVKLRSLESHAIPYFGCDPNTEETKLLLSTYERNREEIIKALNSERFLQETLCKFFTTNSQALDLPKIPLQRPLALPANKEELLAKIVYEEMQQSKYFQESDLVHFLKGIAMQEPYSLKREKINAWDTYYLEKDLDCCENLQKTSAYFNKLSSQKNLVSIVPNKLYYKPMQQGTGIAASAKLAKVSFHYTFSVLGNPETHLGTVVEEDIQHFIPGVARALIGMRRGEKREVYIHPEYGYGEESYFPPNITLIAKIELIDFEETDREAVIAPTQKINERNYEDLLSKLKKINASKYLENGAAFLKYYKCIDSKPFKDTLQKGSLTESFCDQKDEFLVDLSWTLIK